MGDLLVKKDGRAPPSGLPDPVGDKSLPPPRLLSESFLLLPLLSPDLDLDRDLVRDLRPSSSPGTGVLSLLLLLVLDLRLSLLLDRDLRLSLLLVLLRYLFLLLGTSSSPGTVCSGDSSLLVLGGL